MPSCLGGLRRWLGRLLFLDSWPGPRPRRPRCRRRGPPPWRRGRQRAAPGRPRQGRGRASPGLRRRHPWIACRVAELLPQRPARHCRRARGGPRPRRGPPPVHWTRRHPRRWARRLWARLAAAAAKAPGGCPTTARAARLGSAASASSWRRWRSSRDPYTRGRRRRCLRWQVDPGLPPPRRRAAPGPSPKEWRPGAAPRCCGDRCRRRRRALTGATLLVRLGRRRSFALNQLPFADVA